MKEDRYYEKTKERLLEVFIEEYTERMYKDEPFSSVEVVSATIDIVSEELDCDVTSIAEDLFEDAYLEELTQDLQGGAYDQNYNLHSLGLEEKDFL